MSRPVDGTTALAVQSYRTEASRLASIAADLRRAGAKAEADAVGRFAYIALNAGRVEVFNPDPPVGPDCSCETCQAHLFAARWGLAFDHRAERRTGRDT